MSTTESTTTTTAPARTSRVGKRPVTLPKGVSASLAGRVLELKGPKGLMKHTIVDQVDVKVEGDQLTVTTTAPGSAAPRLQGLTRALLASAVKGVAEGYERQLELRGTGYRAELKGKVLHLALGFSHPVAFELPAGITAVIPPDSKGALIVLNGADKAVIGQTAATIRGFRPPEPYGGKGVRYKGEAVREKAGKAGKGGKK